MVFHSLQNLGGRIQILPNVLILMCIAQKCSMPDRLHDSVSNHSKTERSLQGIIGSQHISPGYNRVGIEIEIENRTNAANLRRQTETLESLPQAFPNCIANLI